MRRTIRRCISRDGGARCEPEETNLGNLSADANLWYASVFSKAHVVLLDVTAAELKDILEHGAAGTAPGAAPGQFPQIAG